MPVQNTDTQTSPGIGELPSQFAPLGGCIIDVVGLNDVRLTTQKAASQMFKGWVGSLGPAQSVPDPTRTWLVVAQNAFDASSLATLLGGGIQKANIRITLYDGDSGSPNPVYVAMFGAGSFPYIRWTTQPGDYDFDGGHNLWLGFEDVNANPLPCGYMGECTTYRLGPGPDYDTIDTFTGFPGAFALTDPAFSSTPKPSEYMTPVQVGADPGIWPVTGWFSVPDIYLAALYNEMLTGLLKIGVHDISAGDQYYDFTIGLPEDPPNIPIIPKCGAVNTAF